MGFSRQEYWSGLPCPPPWDLPNPGIKPMSPTLQADSLPSKPPVKPIYIYIYTHRLIYISACCCCCCVASVVSDSATPEKAAHQASRPWDSPGKNTGVGCHFLLQCMKMKSESEVTQSCPTLATP